jgi:ABC-type glycerol-3-phosphate transport system substrate-binding protein
MKKSLILALCVVAVLAACGGGGDDNTTPAATSEVPASASMSVAGLLSYLKLLVASNADTLEPVDVSAVAPPAGDAAEADSVD